MLFDFLKSKCSKLKEYETLYIHCVDCEKSVRTRPYNIITRARTALESFVDAVLDINGVKIPDDFDRRKEIGLSTIADKVNYCTSNGYIDRAEFGKMRSVRLSGNNTSHGETGSEKPSSEADAAEVFRSLYLLIYHYAMGERKTLLAHNEKRPAYKKANGTFVPARRGYDTCDLLSIGDYEMIGPMFSFDTPAPDIKSYKCRRTEVYEGETLYRYAIVKRFVKNSEGDVTQFRDLMAMDTIKKYNSRIAKPPIWSEEITTSVESKVRYLAYFTDENTFLLNQSEEFTRFMTKVGEKGIKAANLARLSILGEIAEIMYSLIDITETLSIHHRNLRPDCIFITPTPKGVAVNIGNFEYSKVMDSDKTKVSDLTIGPGAMAKKFAKDPYASHEVKSLALKDIPNPDWEQVDIYSFGKIVMKVFFNTAKDDTIEKNLNFIRKNMSEAFYDVVYRSIKNDYQNRPTFEEFLKVIRKEIVMME